MAANSVHMMQPFVQESSLKRGRDGDDDPSSLMGFGEHRNKRFQRLPLRTSPHKMGPPNADHIEPLFSSPGGAPSVAPDRTSYRQPPSHFFPWPPSTPSQDLASTQRTDTDSADDVDMDMDIDTGAVLSTSTRHGDPGGLANRLPTPIQPSFAAQVRGSSWGGGPGPALSHASGGTNPGHERSRLGLLVQNQGKVDRWTPRSMEMETEWVQNRTLPSPISEGDDNCPTLTDQTPMSPNGMVLDGRISDFDRSHAHLHPVPVVQASELVETESTASEDRILQDPDLSAHEEPTTPSPHRKGHSRSRHTVNSWTWQPGMKKSFSIGYRADCEKCRQKVPGHFNHIIIS